MALLLQTARSITKFLSTLNPKDLQKAKDMTKDEFRDNFKQMLWKLHQKLTDHGISMQEFQPWFSWDHNFAQEYADLHYDPEEVPPGMGYVRDRSRSRYLDFNNVRMPLPKYSPDCHRVIEHVFGQLSMKLRTAIVTETHVLSTGPEIAAWLQQHFYQLDAASIAADAAGLPNLYKWIRDNDGCWAPRNMR